MRQKRWTTGLLLLAMISLATTAVAQTTTPRQNGKIVFSVFRHDLHSYTGISVMNPDGSGRTQLTKTQILCPPPNRQGCGPDQHDYFPAWSPDGNQIAFLRSVPEPDSRLRYEIFLMNGDGSNQRRLTPGTDVDFARLAWSPDGTMIAFTGRAVTGFDSWLYVINADGSGKRPLVSGTAPAWSPDGSKLAFTSADGLQVVNPDGSGRRLVTAPPSPSPGFFNYDWWPSWSPDGTKIIFNRSIDCDLDDACQSVTIWTVNADGSNPAKLADIAARGGHAWSPDGTKIVFSTDGELFTMEADGRNVTRISYTPDEFEWFPSWQASASPPPPGGNQIDNARFFIRQHYLDFLNREPEPEGFQRWQQILNNCAIGDMRCDRIEISSAFFRSPEFQDRGYFVYRFYPTLGRPPRFDEFIQDLARVSGFLTPEQLEAHKVNFVDGFTHRPEFRNKYNGLTSPSAYVDGLLQTTGLPNHPSRGVWIGALANGTMTRDQVLRALVESSELHHKYYNEAFVVMEYFGYLRRNPDILYLDWIQTMNQNGGDYRVMINGFINSAEYRRRFGP